MTIHKVAVVFDVDAADYDTAISAVKYWAECERDNALMHNAYNQLPEGTVSFTELLNYEYDDFGQRVLYLPPEDGFKRDASGNILPMNLQGDEDTTDDG